MTKPVVCTTDSVASAFQQHGSEIRHFVQGQVRCPDTAADITQEAFLRLTATSAATPIGNLRAFLFRVARNLSIDHLRGRRREDTFDEGLATLYEVTGESPRLDEIVSAQEEIALLQASVAELPEQCQAIFRMSRGEGLAHKDIAQQLRISVSTVEKQLALALNFLRERLQR